MSESLDNFDNAIGIIKKQLADLESRRMALDIAESNKAANPYFRKGTRKLAEFFYSKGYLIVGLEDGVGKNYPLAKQIYACLSVSWDFISKLLKQKKGKFIYETDSFDDASRNKLDILCRNLKTSGMIDFRIDGTCFDVTVTCSNAQRFYLAGECYEEANRYLIDKTIRAFSSSQSNPISHKVYRNIMLKKASSHNDKVNDMQLDFVVEFADRFYVFETKAGQKLYIDKWVDRTRLFNGEKDRFITCCLQEFNPKTFEPFLLLPMKTLEKDFTELLGREFPSDIAPGKAADI